MTIIIQTKVIKSYCINLQNYHYKFPFTWKE